MRKISIVVAVLGLAACSGGNRGYDASGVFEATEVTVSARGTGELVRFDLREGQTVAAGEAVGLIDTMQLRLRKEQLLGTLKAVDARRYNVERQVAALRQQVATARTEQARFESLVRDNAATRKQLDDAEARLTTLEKQLAAQTETLTSGNRGLDGEAQAISAQLAQIEDQIAKSVVVSPLDGVVLGKYAEQGELAAQGRALFKVGDMTNIYLRVYISADQLTSLQLGQRVRVFADWGEKERREYEGTVSWISDKAEFTPKTIQTRDERANLVYAVKIAVTNDGYIKTGMYGETSIADARLTGGGK
jgi:HlyD family secretion protein